MVSNVKMFKHFVPILVLLAVGQQVTTGENHVRCGQKSGPQTDLRIVGGINAEPLEFPWQGSLQYYSDKVGWYHTCGCTLINERWAMTAAHCVDRSGIIDPAKYRFIGGEHDRSRLEGTEITVTVEKIIVSPLWNSTKIDGDVALLKLSRQIDLDDKEKHLVPVCLPSAADSLDDMADKICLATGWGNIAWQGTSPDILQKVAVKIWKQQRCRLTYLFVTNITERMLCFGEDQKGTCQGDSGGPLNCLIDGRWYNYGATSFGVQCAGPTYPSVTARVSQFTEWIWKTVAAN